jgi:PAS domain S-box-containing protein
MKREKDSKSKYNRLPLVLGLSQNGKVKHFNKECQRITGYSRSEVVNRYIWDILLPKYREKQWKNLLNKYIQQETVEEFRCPLITKDHKQISIGWNSFFHENTNNIDKEICFIGENLGLIHFNDYDKNIEKNKTKNNNILTKHTTLKPSSISKSKTPTKEYNKKDLKPPEIGQNEELFTSKTFSRCF